MVIDVYKRQELAGRDYTENDMNEFIVGAAAKLDTPRKPRDEAAATDCKYFCGITDEDVYKRQVLDAIHASTGWLHTGDPALLLHTNGLFASLREKLEKGWFNELLRELFAPAPVEVIQVPALPKNCLLYTSEENASGERPLKQCGGFNYETGYDFPPPFPQERWCCGSGSVSYTHLDVYKRQAGRGAMSQSSSPTGSAVRPGRRAASLAPSFAPMRGRAGSWPLSQAARLWCT